MTILFDQDPLIYKAVYRIVSIQEIKQWFAQGKTKEWMLKEITELGINRLYNMVDNIIEAIEQTGITIDEVEYYLTVCPKSKRKELYPDYKIKRKPNKHVNNIRKYLIDHNYAISHINWESDDLICDRARELGETKALICTLDKDFAQVPGVKFNFYKRPTTKDENGGPVFHEMKGLIVHTKEEAKYSFYLSMLMGDPCDGIKGVPGIGKVKAAKILSTSKNYKLSVIEAYQKYFKENWKYEYDKSYFNLYLGCNREEPESLDGAISDAVKLTKQLENSINV
jgi:5'-3' exonuclease